MRMLGIDFNDASLTGAADGQLLFSEPACALAPDGELLFGQAARALSRRYPRRMQNRYWEDLSETPLPEPLGPALTAADLAHAQLARLWAEHGQQCDAAAFAVTSAWSTEQLGLLLGIAEEESIPVAGFVDAAVAATRREYPGRLLLAAEARLHAIDLSLMEQAGQASVGQRHVLDGIGVERLERISMEYCASCFLKEARFDPLHQAESEQALFDLLPGWLDELMRAPSIPAELTLAGDTCRVELQQAALAERIIDACQPLLQRLRALLPAGRPTAVQLGARLAAFPGLVTALSALPGTAVFVLDTGAVARGACRLAHVPKREGFRLLNQLPWDQPAAPELPASAAESAPLPTHLLAGARAYRLGTRAFCIGTEIVEGDYGLVLDSRLGGVSRRHCSLQLDDGRVVLVDHSRYGTRLNGHPIEGSAVLQAGDVIAVGTPPCEFRVVTEVEPDGP